MKLLESLINLIESESSDSSLYQGIKDFLEGKISASELEYKYDDLIFDVKESKSGNRKLTTITLKFDSVVDYFKTFNLGYEDEGFVDALFSYYGDSLNIYDSYYSKEDWQDGRIAKYYFNGENQNLLKEIIKYFEPEWYKVDLNDWDSSVFIKLREVFESEIEEIQSEFSSEVNYAYENKAKEEIINDFEDIYRDYGIYLSSSFSKYYTTPLNLIDLYEKYDPTKKKTLKEILTVIGEEIRPWGDFWDVAYQLDYHSSFDDESFNRNVNWQLEKIKDKIEDGEVDENLNPNFDKYRDVIEEVLRKFDFNKWYPLPVNPGKSFKINQIDQDSNKIKISLKNNSGGLEQQYLLTLEGLYTFMYNYKLFD